MELLGVEDEGVILRCLSGSARAADRTGDLGEKGDLLVIAADIFWTSHLLVGEKGRLARTIKHHLCFDIFFRAIRPAHFYATHRAIVGYHSLSLRASH